MEDQRLEEAWYQLHRNEVAKDCCCWKENYDPWLLTKPLENNDYSSLCGNWSEMNYFLLGLIIGRLSVSNSNKKEDDKNDSYPL